MYEGNKLLLTWNNDQLNRCYLLIGSQPIVCKCHRVIDQSGSSSSSWFISWLFWLPFTSDRLKGWVLTTFSLWIQGYDWKLWWVTYIYVWPINGQLGSPGHSTSLTIIAQISGEKEKLRSDVEKLIKNMAIHQLELFSCLCLQNNCKYYNRWYKSYYSTILTTALEYNKHEDRVYSLFGMCSSSKLSAPTYMKRTSIII